MEEHYANHAHDARGSYDITVTRFTFPLSYILELFLTRKRNRNDSVAIHVILCTFQFSGPRTDILTYLPHVNLTSMYAWVILL